MLFSQIGRAQYKKRNYTYNGHELKYIVTRTTQGGQSLIAEVVWRLLK